jgi:XisI protein
LKDQLICDYQSNNFQLVTTGCTNNKYHYIVNFRFTIKPTGRIWLLANNTDIRIAEELVEKGVPRMDIVLGFQQPQFRQYTNFATA